MLICAELAPLTMCLEILETKLPDLCVGLIWLLLGYTWIVCVVITLCNSKKYTALASQQTK